MVKAYNMLKYNQVTISTIFRLIYHKNFPENHLNFLEKKIKKRIAIYVTALKKVQQTINSLRKKDAKEIFKFKSPSN